MSSPIRPTEAPEALWTVQQVASFLSMSVSWVYKEIEAGRLPCIRLGAAVRFVPQEIRRYVDGLNSVTGDLLKGHDVASKLAGHVHADGRATRRKES